MLLQDPPSHRYDWHWRLGATPVRVHPSFWLMAGLLGLTSGLRFSDALFNLAILGVWLAALFASLLLHELGHALAMRGLAGGRARITLYAFGGLTIGPEGRTRVERLGIVAAGPAFSLLAGLPCLALVLLWHAGWLLPPPAVVQLVVRDLMWINVVWGLLNALPIYPLDGGLILLELATARRPGTGWRFAHALSLAVALAAAGGSIYAGQWFAALVFLYLAYVNYQGRQDLPGI